MKACLIKLSDLITYPKAFLIKISKDPDHFHYIFHIYNVLFQKQPPRGVPLKRYSAKTKIFKTTGILLKFVLHKKWNLVEWIPLILDRKRKCAMEMILVCKMYSLGLQIAALPKFKIFLTKLQSTKFHACAIKDTINPVQLFTFTNIIHFSRLPLWVGCFIYFKFTLLSSIVYQSLIKETNWLINKGMCVLLFDVLKHLQLRKTDVLKTCRKKKIEEMHELWRAKRNKVYSEKGLFWHYYLQLSFLYRTVSQISFKLFCSGDKIGFYQSSLGYEVDFRDIMNVFPNILVKN